MESSQKRASYEDWGRDRDRASGLIPSPILLHPHPSFAGSWRSASVKAHSGTRRRCGRCCPCASAAGRVLRPPPPPPHRSPQPPREPCSGWCRGRPGKSTGRCRCWRGLSRLSLASRGVCPAKAASEDPAPLPRPAPPDWPPEGAVRASHRLQDRPGACESLRGGLVPAPAPYGYPAYLCLQ